MVQDILLKIDSSADSGKGDEELIQEWCGAVMALVLVPPDNRMDAAHANALRWEMERKAM